MLFNQFDNSDFDKLENDLKFLDTYDAKIKNIVIVNNVPRSLTLSMKILEDKFISSYQNINFNLDEFNSYNLNFSDILNEYSGL